MRRLLSSFLSRALTRVAIRQSMRAGLALTTAASVSFGATIKDLSDELPTRSEYHIRDLSRVNAVIWHHSATKGQTIRNLAEFHTEVKKWPGIGYHYAIGWDGIVYKLNDPERLTYHAQGHNSHSIGVVLVGNYEDRELTEAMKEAIVKMSEYLAEEYNCRKILLHRDTKATLCPGRYAGNFLTDLRDGADADS